MGEHEDEVIYRLLGQMSKVHTEVFDMGPKLCLEDESCQIMSSFAPRTEVCGCVLRCVGETTG